MDFDQWCSLHGGYLNDGDDAAKAAKAMARWAWGAAELAKCIPMTVLDIEDDDALRFIQRVLEGDVPEQDRVVARDLVVAIRTRLRRLTPNPK